MARLHLGAYVRKHSGAFWEGAVVGHYSTAQTPEGIAVQLFGWPDGPVQIYPAAALELCDHSKSRLPPPPQTHVRVYPQELTDDLRFILSMMMWTTGPMAHALRDGGQDIKRKAEEEQAEVMHWLIGLALEHGSEWRAKASDRIREIQAALATTEGSDG